MQHFHVFPAPPGHPATEQTSRGDVYELEQGHPTCILLRSEAISWQGPAVQASAKRFVKRIHETVETLR